MPSNLPLTNEAPPIIAINMGQTFSVEREERANSAQVQLDGLRADLDRLQSDYANLEEEKRLYEQCFVLYYHKYVKALEEQHQLDLYAAEKCEELHEKVSYLIKKTDLVVSYAHQKEMMIAGLIEKKNCLERELEGYRGQVPRDGTGGQVSRNTSGDQLPRNVAGAQLPSESVDQWLWSEEPIASGKYRHAGHSSGITILNNANSSRPTKTVRFSSPIEQTPQPGSSSTRTHGLDAGYSSGAIVPSDDKSSKPSKTVRFSSLIEQRQTPKPVPSSSNRTHGLDSAQSKSSDATGGSQAQSATGLKSAALPAQKALDRAVLKPLSANKITKKSVRPSKGVPMTALSSKNHRPLHDKPIIKDIRSSIGDSAALDKPSSVGTQNKKQPQPGEDATADPGRVRRSVFGHSGFSEENTAIEPVRPCLKKPIADLSSVTKSSVPDELSATGPPPSKKQKLAIPKTEEAIADEKGTRGGVGPAAASAHKSDDAHKQPIDAADFDVRPLFKKPIIVQQDLTKVFFARCPILDQKPTTTARAAAATSNEDEAQMTEVSGRPWDTGKVETLSSSSDDGCPSAGELMDLEW